MLKNFRNRKSRNRKSRNRKSRNRKSRNRKSRNRKSRNRKSRNRKSRNRKGGMGNDNNDYDKNKLYKILQAFDNASYKWGLLHAENYYINNFESLYEIIFGKNDKSKIDEFLQLYHNNKEDLEKNFRIKGFKDINDVIDIFLPLKDKIKEYCPFQYEFEKKIYNNHYLDMYYLKHMNKNIYIETDTEKIIFTDHFIFCLCIFQFYVVYSKLPIHFLSIKNHGGSGSIYDEKVRNYFNMCSKYKPNCRGIEAKEKHISVSTHPPLTLKEFIKKIWDDNKSDMKKKGFKNTKIYEKIKKIFNNNEDIHSDENKVLIGGFFLILYTGSYHKVFSCPWYDPEFKLPYKPPYLRYKNLAKCCGKFIDYFLVNYDNKVMKDLMEQKISLLAIHDKNIYHRKAIENLYSRRRLNRLFFCKAYKCREIKKSEEINLDVGTVVERLSRLSCFRGFNFGFQELNTKYGGVMDKKFVYGFTFVKESDTDPTKWVNYEMTTQELKSNPDPQKEILVAFGYNDKRKKFIPPYNVNGKIFPSSVYQLEVNAPRKIYKIDYLKNFFFDIDRKFLNNKEGELTTEELPDYDGKPENTLELGFFENNLVYAYKHIQIESEVQKEQNKILFEGFTSWTLDIDRAAFFANSDQKPGILFFCKQRDQFNNNPNSVGCYHSGCPSFYIAPWSDYEIEAEIIFGSNSIFKLTDIVLLYTYNKDLDDNKYKKIVIYCYELYNESWNPDKEYDFVAPGLKKK